MLHQTSKNMAWETQVREIIAGFLKKLKSSTTSAESHSPEDDINGPILQTEGYTTKINPYTTKYLSTVDEKIRDLIGNNLNVNSIQKFSQIFLEEYNENILIEKTSDLRMNKDDVTRLSNTATAIFLENWLSSDTTHRMNVTHFSQRNFREKSKPNWGFAIHNFEPSEESRYRKAYQHYCEIEKEILEQLKRENQVLPKKPTKSENLRGKPVMLDYITLAFLHAWCEEGFRFIKRYWQSRFFVPDKHVYQQSTDTVAYQHNARTNQLLCNDLLSLYEYIEKLKDSYDRANSEESLTKYVTGCMVIYRMERSVHFDFFSRWVIKQLQGGAVQDNYARACLEDSIGRLPGFCGLLVGGKEEMVEDSSNGPIFKSDYTIVNEPLDVLNHQHIINLCTSLSGLRVYMAGMRVLLHRAILSDLLVMLHGMFQMSKLRPWELADFRAAADFFAKDFKFLEKALEARAPDLGVKDSAVDGQCYYDLLVQQMRYLYRNEELPGRIIVESQKPSSKSKTGHTK